MTVDATEYVVERSPGGLTYGPWQQHDTQADVWALSATTDRGRVRLLLDETAMYELWTEIQHTPWPREPRPEGRLAAEVVEHARHASREQLQAALEVLERGGR